MGIKSLDELKELAAQAEETNEVLDPMEEVEQDLEAKATNEESEDVETTEETTEEPEQETKEATADSEEIEEEETSLEETTQDTEDLYKMDRKYKSLDQEFEIPEWAAAGVKSEEQANELKDIYQRAAGVSFLKEKNETLRGERDDFKGKFDETNQTLQYLDQLVENKDLANIQKMARLSDDDILNRAAEILEVQKLTPEQQQAYNNQVAQRNQNYFNTLENANLKQQLQQSSSQSHEELLGQELTKPEVSEIINFYDTKMGQSGAFRQKVIDHAVRLEQESLAKGQLQSLTPAEAVAAVLGEVKPFFTPQKLEQTPAKTPTETPNATVETQTKTPVVDPRSKPVIPKVGGGAKSPAKKVFKSIQDLKDHAASFED